MQQARIILCQSKPCVSIVRRDFMATRQLHTPTGIVLEEYEDAKDILKKELAIATSLQQEVDAIRKYLGV